MAIGMCHFRYFWNGMFAQAEGQNTADIGNQFIMGVSLTNSRRIP